MRKPRVLLDCDGILANFIEPCLDVLHTLTDERYVHDDVKEWAIEKSLGVPKETWDQVYTKMQVAGFCSSIPLYPGTKDAIAELMSIADLYIVTSPLGGPHWAHEREKWLFEHFGIPAKKVASISSKYIVAGDVFMDDKTSHLVEWTNHNPDGVAVRWNRLYNAGDEWAGLQTDKWDVFLGIVKGVSACLK